MEDVEARQVALEHVGVLEAEDQAERVVLLGAGDVGVAADDGEQRRIAIDFALSTARCVRVVASKVSALTVTLIAVMPDAAMASRCFCDSGPRGGHETFIDPGLASASMTIERL